jgi:integrase
MIRASLEAKQIKGRKGWRVYIPATMSSTGKPQKVDGKTKAEAEYRADEIVGFRRERGALVAALSPHELTEAVQACALLRPTGIGLLEAVAAFLDERKKREASMTFAKAFDAYEALPNRSDDYNSSLRHTRKKVESLLDRKIVDITVADLEDALKGLPASTRNLRVNRLRSVFRYAVRKGWLETSPAERLDILKIKKDEVEIYHAADVKRLLDDALKNDKELVPFLVVAAFCGLRPEREAFHLFWSDIHIDDKNPEVLVRPELSKTRRKRNVPLSSNAIEWLKAAGVKKSGRICDFSEMTLIRKRAKNHERRASEDQAAVKVVKDGLHHAFCSAHLAEYGDITKSLLASGHTDAKVFWGHYHRAMSKDEAAGCWAVKPEFKPMF